MDINAIQVKFNTLVTGALLGLTALFGGWDAALKILLILIIIDYVTGFMKGIMKKDLSSAVGWTGLLRKGAIFLIVIMAHQLDVAMGNAAPLFRTATAYFYIANEGISITENIGALGVPLPAFIVELLRAMKDQHDKKPEVKQHE